MSETKNTKHKDSFIVLLLVLLCLIFRLLNFVGIGINDDIAYIQNARLLASGYSPISSGFNQLGFRLGMVVPLAILYKIFGLNDIAFSLYPLICSLITCALIYYTALRLWGKRAAVFASLLWIVYPLQIVFDTQLSPSNQQATFVMAAMFLYYLSITGKTPSTSDLSPSPDWREPALLVLSGVCIGLGWWFNEIFVTFIIVALPFILIVRPKFKHLLWITAGFLLVFSLELLIVKISAGSWLARFNCILETESIVESNESKEYLKRTLFKVFHLNLYNEEGHFGILWYLFAVATILALYFKKKVALALALGCWLWLAYLQWGFQSFDLDPITKYIRYISMIVPLQCMVFGAIFSHLCALSKNKKFITMFVFALLFIHLLWLGTIAASIVKVHTDDFKEIAQYLLTLNLKEDDIVYADDLTANFVEIYSKGNLKIQRTNHFKQQNPPTKGVFIDDGSWYFVRLPDYRKTTPKWCQSPPLVYWPLIHTVHGKNIGVYANFDPKIYWILPKH